MSLTRFRKEQVENEEVAVGGSTLKDGSYLKADGSTQVDIQLDYGNEGGNDTMQAVVNRGRFDLSRYEMGEHWRYTMTDGKSVGDAMEEFLPIANPSASFAIAQQNIVDGDASLQEAENEDNLGFLKRALRMDEVVMEASHADRYSETGLAHYQAGDALGWETINVNDHFTDIVPDDDGVAQNVFKAAARLAQAAAVGYSFRNPEADAATIFALASADGSNVGDVVVALDTGVAYLRTNTQDEEDSWVDFNESVAQTALDDGLAADLAGHNAALAQAIVDMDAQSVVKKAHFDDKIVALRSDMQNAFAETLRRNVMARISSSVTLEVADIEAGSKTIAIQAPEAGFPLDSSTMRFFCNGLLQGATVGTRSEAVDGSVTLDLNLAALGMVTGDKLLVEARQKAVTDAGEGLLDTTISSGYVHVAHSIDLSAFEG
jgi:hypothetical protein